MGDFVLDLTPGAKERLRAASERLRFIPDLQTRVLERDGFGLCVTFRGDETLWSPAVFDDGSFCVVAGMPAFDPEVWEEASRDRGIGGLAGKATWRLYQRHGDVAKWQNGNCATIIYDAKFQVLRLICDRAGAYPVFEIRKSDRVAFGSHPDVLAKVGDVESDLDEISLAEFVVSSKLTFPYTYYSQVRAVDMGTELEIQTETGQIKRRSYYALDYAGKPDQDERSLATELAATFRRSVLRRSHRRLGAPVIALSGGMDSRLILASLAEPDRALAFTCYDAPNRELATAEALARLAGVRFLPLKRGSDYYAENAEEGIRISGGMGTFANNHFLGFLPRLHEEGIGSLLTGCYCDYLFKGLPLNRKTHWFTGRESLSDFSHAFYFTHWMPDTPLTRQVRERWEAQIPFELRAQESIEQIHAVEMRRTFPLAYEADNQQRVVPQRLTNWMLPAGDRDVLDVYRRIPSAWKLNRRIFLMASHELLGSSPLGRVPDANTGAPLFASAARQRVSEINLRVRRKLKTRRRTLASDGSWPDWHYYLTHSAKMGELWRRPQPEAEDFFRKLMGWKMMPSGPEDFQDGRVFLFVPLLSQKIWFERRR